MAVHIDASEVRTLAVDLAAAGGRMDARSRATIRKAAVRIKAGLRAEFGGHDYAPGVGPAVDFDTYGSGSFYGAEIGVNKDRYQGPLGNLLAFGSSNNAPVASLDTPWRREFHPLQENLGDAAEESVLGGGGRA
jgi:hypothetical protein